MSKFLKIVIPLLLLTGCYNPPVILKPFPTPIPIVSPSPIIPTPTPSAVVTSTPTTVPTIAPTAVPTPAPTAVPTVTPTAVPTVVPTDTPTSAPISASSGITISANGFVDSIGINSHFSYGNTIYRDNAPLVVDAILGLHIMHMREGMLIPFNRQFDSYQYAVKRLSAAGVRNIGGVQAYDLMAPDFATRWANWFDSVGGLNWVEGTEPPNECDLNDCLNNVPDYQKILYNVIKNYAPSNSISVLGPSLVKFSSYSQSGDLSAYMDNGNGHFYTLSQPPETSGSCKMSDECAGGDGPGGNIGNTFSLEALIKGDAVTSGTKPIINTETGYCTTVTDQGTSYNDIPEDVQADYWPRYLLHAYGDLNIPRTFIYDIADDGLSAPTFDKCGLIDNQGRQKPSYKILKSMLDAVNDPGPVYTPDPLNYAIGAPKNVDGNDIKSMAVGLRNGSYALFIWNPVSRWYQQSGNGGNKSHYLYPATIPASLVITKSFTTATVTTYDSSTGQATTINADPNQAINITATTTITMILLK